MCSKKIPFMSSERELIVVLVIDQPIIENKRTCAKNIELKKQAWEDLTVAYNSHQHVTQRNSTQLKRCWKNIKIQNFPPPLKRKLYDIDIPTTSCKITRKVLSGENNFDEDETCNPSPKKMSKELKHLLTSNKNLMRETLARIQRTEMNTQHDQALFELRMEREKDLIQGEKNNLEYEKTIHRLQVGKLELEINSLKKKQ